MKKKMQQIDVTNIPIIIIGWYYKRGKAHKEKPTRLRQPVEATTGKTINCNPSQWRTPP